MNRALTSDSSARTQVPGARRVLGTIFSESASTLKLEIFYISFKVFPFSPREKLHFSFLKIKFY